MMHLLRNKVSTTYYILQISQLLCIKLACIGINLFDCSQVYVDAGELSRLMRVDWSEIEKNLDASESYSRYFDSATNAIVAAEIKDTGDKLASLASSFHIYVPPPQV